VTALAPANLKRRLQFLRRRLGSTAPDGDKAAEISSQQRSPQSLQPTRWRGSVMPNSQHVYELRPRKDKRGVNLISDARPFARLWYCEPANAIDYAQFRSRSHDAVIRVYEEAGNVMETHEHAGNFKEPRASHAKQKPPRALKRGG
jgi:hypothetical protein